MCHICKDRGFYGGQLNGQYTGPWKWCTCPAALERQHTNPELVNRANAARERLLRIIPKKREKQAQHVEDVYRGEF